MEEHQNSTVTNAPFHLPFFAVDELGGTDAEEEVKGAALAGGSSSSLPTEPIINYHRLQLPALTAITSEAQVTCVAFTSERIAIGTLQGYIYVLSSGGVQQCVFEAHDGHRINDLSIDLSGHFLATCGESGMVTVHWMDSAEEGRYSWKYQYSVAVCSIALFPDYSPDSVSTKLVCVGLQDGRVLLNRRGLFTSSNIFIHTDEGAIESVKWRGKLLAWASASGVKIYDVVAGVKVSYIPKPMGLKTARLSKEEGVKVHGNRLELSRDAATSFTSAVSSISSSDGAYGFATFLCWASDSTLLISKGYDIKIVAIKEKAVGSASRYPPLKSLEAQSVKYAEVTHCIHCEHSICAVVPFDATDASPGTLLSVLEVDLSETSQDKSGALGPMYGIPFHQIMRWDGSVRCQEWLQYETLPLGFPPVPFRLEYRDCTLPSYVVLPSEIIQIRRRDIQDHALWLHAQGAYEEAIQVAKKGSVELLEVTGYACVTSLLEKHCFERAAALVSEVCASQKAWKLYIYKFENCHALPLLAEYLPPPDAVSPLAALQLQNTHQETPSGSSAASLSSGSTSSIFRGSPPPFGGNAVMLNHSSRLYASEKTPFLLQLVRPSIALYDYVLKRLAELSPPTLLTVLHRWPCQQFGIAALIERLQSIMDAHEKKAATFPRGLASFRHTLLNQSDGRSSPSARVEPPLSSTTPASHEAPSSEGSHSVAGPHTATFGHVTPVLHCLSYLYELSGRRVQALEMLLRLQSLHAFTLLDAYAETDRDVRDFAIANAARLMHLDPHRTIDTFLSSDRLSLFPVNAVASQLMSDRQLLHIYLKSVFFKEPALSRDFHRFQLKLFAEFDPHLLVDFLRDAQGNYDIDEALRISKNPALLSLNTVNEWTPSNKPLQDSKGPPPTLPLESGTAAAADGVASMSGARSSVLPSFLYAQVFLFGLSGMTREALHILLYKLQDIPASIQLVCQKNDSTLWQYLMQFMLNHPRLLVEVLSYLDKNEHLAVSYTAAPYTSSPTASVVASCLNAPFASVELLRRLPNGDFHKIPRIEKKIGRILADLQLQMALTKLCVEAIKVDERCFHNEWLYRRRRGFALRTATTPQPLTAPFEDFQGAADPMESGAATRIRDSKRVLGNTSTIPASPILSMVRRPQASMVYQRTPSMPTLLPQPYASMEMPPKERSMGRGALDLNAYSLEVSSPFPIPTQRNASFSMHSAYGCLDSGIPEDLPPLKDRRRLSFLSYYAASVAAPPSPSLSHRGQPYAFPPPLYNTAETNTLRPKAQQPTRVTFAFPAARCCVCELPLFANGRPGVPMASQANAPSSMLVPNTSEGNGVSEPYLAATAESYREEEGLVLFLCGHSSHLSCQKRKNATVDPFEGASAKQSLPTDTVNGRSSSGLLPYDCFICRRAPEGNWIHSAGHPPTWNPTRVRLVQ